MPIDRDKRKRAAASEADEEGGETSSAPPMRHAAASTGEMVSARAVGFEAGAMQLGPKTVTAQEGAPEHIMKWLDSASWLFIAGVSKLWSEEYEAHDGTQHRAYTSVAAALATRERTEWTIANLPLLARRAGQESYLHLLLCDAGFCEALGGAASDGPALRRLLPDAYLSCLDAGVLCTGAAFQGRLELLQWVHSRPPCLPSSADLDLWSAESTALESMAAAAARGGHVHILQWLLAGVSTETLCESPGHREAVLAMIIGAAEGGSEAALRWVLDNKLQAMLQGRSSRHNGSRRLRLVQAKRRTREPEDADLSGTELDLDTCDRILEVKKWLGRSGKAAEQALHAAAHYGRTDMVELLVRWFGARKRIRLSCALVAGVAATAGSMQLLKGLDLTALRHDANSDCDSDADSDSHWQGNLVMLAAVVSPHAGVAVLHWLRCQRVGDWSCGALRKLLDAGGRTGRKAVIPKLAYLRRVGAPWPDRFSDTRPIPRGALLTMRGGMPAARGRARWSDDTSEEGEEDRCQWYWPLDTLEWALEQGCPSAACIAGFSCGAYQQGARAPHYLLTAQWSGAEYGSVLPQTVTYPGDAERLRGQARALLRRVHAAGCACDGGACPHSNGRRPRLPVKIVDERGAHRGEAYVQAVPSVNTAYSYSSRR
ncbi:hypothetical protein JKP88DRAFT_276290 [Tribonema minus]|uniref:Uncharacterized protein n=1 Tax=Tribonema minus TaxID=303371 RepID=A0A836CIL7_9STRA|nr:hypothetical protein JKP88DRAFT_276290 [Tribonema minus]